MPDKRTTADWLQLLREDRAAIWTSIKRFGEHLVEAHKELSAIEWESLVAELRKDQTRAELDAAMAVGDGSLDERLFPAGVVHSKVMNMTRVDQNRLLSGERFPVYSDSSPNATDAEQKTWAEMTREQRSRLISDKGGRIQPLAEQKPPRLSRAQRIEVYATATYHAADGYLTLRNGGREGRIDIRTLHNSLTQDDRAALASALR